MAYRIACQGSFMAIPSLICLLLSWSCFQSSCKKQDSIRSDIKGYWALVEAQRNGKPTLTLENAFINFIQDSVLETNLLRKTVQSSFVQFDKRIIQDYPERIEYEIQLRSNDSLYLQTEIRGYEFNFTLVYVDSLSTRNLSSIN